MAIVLQAAGKIKMVVSNRKQDLLNAKAALNASKSDADNHLNDYFNLIRSDNPCAAARAYADYLFAKDQAAAISHASDVYFAACEVCDKAENNYYKSALAYDVYMKATAIYMKATSAYLDAKKIMEK